MSRLVNANTKALETISKANTQELNNFSWPRNEGTSASEMASCGGKVVLELRNPVQHSGKKLRIFRRGHLFEEDQAERFVAMGYREVSCDPDTFRHEPGPCFCRQMTLEMPGMPIGAHLDFVVKHKNGELLVIECKTTDGIPEEPYDSWVIQMLIQLGLVSLHFPKTQIRGSILAADLNEGEEHEFPGYLPNETMFQNYIMNKGLPLIEAKKGLAEPKYEAGLICCKCTFRGICPVYSSDADLPDEIKDLARQHLAANEAKAAAEKILKKLKGTISGFTGGRFKAITDEFSLVSSWIPSTETVDTTLLRRKHPDVYADVTKEKAGYIRLEIKRLEPA